MSETTLTSLAGGARVLTVLFVALLAASGVVAAHGGDDGMHHHDGMMGTHDGWMGGTGWFWGPVWMLLLLAVPLVAVAYLLRSRQGSDGGGSDDALAVLRRRYAKGEIDDEEFESRRQQLQQG